MCPSKSVLSQTKNGIMTFCNQTKLFQLMYNNLCFELYEWELEKFAEYLLDIDVAYWQNELKCSIHSRRIPITVGTKHLIVLVNAQELEEIQNLITRKEPQKILSTNEIDYRYIAN